MGIKLVTFAAQTVTPQDDALIYETALQESGMIYGGVVTIKNANVLHVDAGHGALCGRKFTIEATDVPVPLTASGSLQGRIYIHMDLSDTGEPISFQVETASSLTPVIQQADVNINSGIYEINLATFIVDTSTISNLVNVAPFIDIEPDSGFNAQSNNPVQNKVITKAVGVPETIGGLASQEYNIGDTLVATDGQFYDVIAHISPNATIVLNGNVTLGGNIVDLINSLSSQISKLATVQEYILLTDQVLLHTCGKTAVIDFSVPQRSLTAGENVLGTLAAGYRPSRTYRSSMCTSGQNNVFAYVLPNGNYGLYAFQATSCIAFGQLFFYMES